MKKTILYSLHYFFGSYDFVAKDCNGNTLYFNMFEGIYDCKFGLNRNLRKKI